MKQKVSDRILELQQKYLLTGDTKALSDLYEAILRFSMSLLKYGKHRPMSYDELGELVEDLTSNLIQRLMTTNKEVFTGPPMAYLKTSIWHASDPKKRGIDNIVQIPEDTEMDMVYATESMDPVFDEIIYGDLENIIAGYIDHILLDADPDIANMLREAFNSCVYSNSYYVRYSYKINEKDMRDKFLELMLGFQEYLHEGL